MKRVRRFLLTVMSLTALMALVGPPAQAFHLYRGPGGGCTPTDGATTDNAPANVTAATTVQVQHNTFLDTKSNTPVTHVKAGQAVTWTWNSAHCHSIQAQGTDTDRFYSGFHYPTTVPTSLRAVPGFFDYPVLEANPTLSWTHVFNVPGTYRYLCEHHYDIGMNGLVIVDP